MTFNEVMTNIANKIRNILGINDKIRLTEIPDYIDNACDQSYFWGEGAGYWNGYDEGYDEGYGKGDYDGYWRGYDIGLDHGRIEGEMAEYDRFWDSFQVNGNRRNYPYGFSGSCWQDDTYNPKYEIIVTSMCGGMFQYNTPITSTKVPITIDSAVTAPSVFLGCTRLREIPSIKVTEKVPEFTYWFQGCDALTTINFTDDSVIGNSINFQWSPLTPESAWNVVQHLKDVGGGDEYLKYTITFSAAVWEALDEYQRENDLTGGWQFVREYIENEIGWRTA